jgi:hypothetical protein
MAERQEALKKLVVEWHLNVAERQILGNVQRQEVFEIVKALLLTQGAFPTHVGRTTNEGARLIRVSSGVQIVWQRSYPWDPSTVAERHTETYAEIDLAIQKYIDTEWRSGIDGIVLK